MKNVYAIYDKAAVSFCLPFCFDAHGQALRAFECELTTPDSKICQFPQDYALYHVGQFDLTTGELLHKKPDCLTDGIRLKAEIAERQKKVLSTQAE